MRGSSFGEVGNCPIFMAENGNIAYITRISDTKTVMETEIEDRKTEIVIIIVTDFRNHRS